MTESPSSVISYNLVMVAFQWFLSVFLLLVKLGKLLLYKIIIKGLEELCSHMMGLFH